MPDHDQPSGNLAGMIRVPPIEDEKVMADQDQPPANLAGMIKTPPTEDEKARVVTNIKPRGAKQEEEPLDRSWREEALSTSEKAKVEQILQAAQSRDAQRLGQLAVDRAGFVEDKVRRRIWPMVLGCEVDDSSSAPATTLTKDWRTLPAHADEEQVALDVHRAFVHYPANESAASLASRRTALSDLILSILRTHPQLSYFQGYHDIAQVFLLVLGLEAAGPALARLSLLKIRDFMLPTMAGTNPHLHLIPPILAAADPHLHAHLAGLQPFFALAATLTLFAHDVDNYADIARLFDYLLSRDDAVAALYLYAAVILLRREELLDIGTDEPDMLFHVLSKLPRPLDLDALIMRAEGLLRDFPPEKLSTRAWRAVSSSSVLKTTRGQGSVRSQSLAMGEEWLAKQTREIQREDARKARLERMRRMMVVYRRPASLAVLAVLVGFLSIWFGRNGGALPTIGAVGILHHAQLRVLGPMRRFLGFGG